MGVPKRKTSKMKRRQRQAHTLKKDMPSSMVCPKCGAAQQPHRVCPKCGNYKGRQVLIVNADE